MLRSERMKSVYQILAVLVLCMAFAFAIALFDGLWVALGIFGVGFVVIGASRYIRTPPRG